jgi:hypothetical protein
MVYYEVLFSEFCNCNVSHSYVDTADSINVKSITVNVTGNSVKLRWDEPAEPNGIAMSYNINITRVDSAKTNVRTSDSIIYVVFSPFTIQHLLNFFLLSSQEPSHITCITRKEFNNTGRNYTFPTLLQPGNYSIRIQVISLAPNKANYTVAKFFLIEVPPCRPNSLLILHSYRLHNNYIATGNL